MTRFKRERAKKERRKIIGIINNKATNPLKSARLVKKRKTPHAMLENEALPSIHYPPSINPISTKTI
jgi:hypothetical protein